MQFPLHYGLSWSLNIVQETTWWTLAALAAFLVTSYNGVKEPANEVPFPLAPANA